MTVTQFKHVIEVEKAGSINKAASNLFIAQSVLSNSIRSLEDELGRPIFIRTNRGSELTSFGKEFLSYIRPINMKIDQLIKRLQNNSRSNELS